jgi:hypothetical protein
MRQLVHWQQAIETAGAAGKTAGAVAAGYSRQARIMKQDTSVTIWTVVLYTAFHFKVNSEYVGR